MENTDAFCKQEPKQNLRTCSRLSYFCSNRNVIENLITGSGSVTYGKIASLGLFVLAAMSREKPVPYEWNLSLPFL